MLVQVALGIRSVGGESSPVDTAKASGGSLTLVERKSRPLCDMFHASFPFDPPNAGPQPTPGSRTARRVPPMNRTPRGRLQALVRLRARLVVGDAHIFFIGIEFVCVCKPTSADRQV